MSGQDTIILGNWKMHFTVKQAVMYAQKIAAKQIPEGVMVGIAPQTLAISEIATSLQKEKSAVAVIAQNAFHQDEGAFTGEISMPMLRGLAQYVLVGHSERRHVLRESNDFIREKNAAAIRSGITPVFCIGETLVERQHFHTNQVLSDQITLGLADLTTEEVANIVIAYEPVWAIGTGEYASPEEVAKAVEKIRAEVTSLYGAITGASVHVLYGGSVTKDNAASYLAIPGVNGLLVGGASITLSKFWPIIEVAASLHKKQVSIAVKRSA